jgi:gamma-glutamyltranspeptidase/glutathione hydrolase
LNSKRKQPARWRQCKPPTLAVAIGLALAGCNIGQQTTGVPPGFAGGVVADEPRAALAGRDILAAGGSAADAVVAAALAMAVTLPSRTGLGGGGMCLVYDPRLNRVEALDFAARTPAAPSAAAVPAMVRGLAVVYGRQGRLRWEQLVAPAEGLARFGVPVSRALANDLSAAGAALLRDPAARQVFARADGAPLGEGDQLVQSDLSTVLAAIRARGTAEMNQGQTADQIAGGAITIGAGITPEDLKSVGATPRPSVLVRHDDIAVHFAPPPAVAGTSEAQLFAMLAPRWRRTNAEERPHLLAEADLRAAADRARWLKPDLSTSVPPSDLATQQRANELMATYRANARTAPDAMPVAAPQLINTATAGVAAVDREGGGVACSFTMNETFGIGRVVPGTGVLLAAAPDGAARGPQLLTPMLAAMARGGRITFASTASGGWPGASAQVQVALRTVVEARPLEEAMDAARIHNPGTEDVLAEEALQGPLPGLAARGYRPRLTPNLGQVNAIYCPEGLFENAEACQFRADRRGAGLGASR